MGAWLTRMYERHGSRYCAVAIGFLIVFTVLVSAPGTLAFPAQYLDLSVAEYLLAVGVTAVGITVTAAIVLVRFRKDLRPLFVWAAGDRSPTLVANADTWAYTLPRRVLVVAVLLGTVVILPPITLALTLPANHDGPLGLLEITLGGLGAGAVGAMIAYVVVELVLHPVRASIPRYDLPRSGSTRLATTILVAPVSLTFLTCIAFGFLLVDREESGEGGLFIAYAAALGVSAIFATVTVPLLSGGVLGPIRDLIRSNRAVGEGDLARMRVTTTDEFGELAVSFNEMVDGLREREALRSHNEELVEELRASRSRIVAASNEARRRVERDLHDGAQQSLMLLNLKLGLIERKLGEDPTTAPELLSESRGDLDRALDELRDLAHGIYPAVLTSDGLPGALGEAVEQAPIAATLDLDGARRYSPELEAAVYFCCLEALQNAAKHAGEGASASVRLEQRNGELRFQVADDGRGFDPDSEAGDSAGLQNMADRIGALGGDVRIDSRPGGGTTVAGSVPLDR